MRRRIFYGFQPINEEINKKNQKSLIWALPIIYLIIFLIYFFINKEIFNIEKIYINSSIDLKYISYAILFILLIFYVVYIFSFLFKKTQDFRTNLFRYIIMFFQYILLLPVILLSVSNNSLLILISCFSYISLFFITPILKYFGKHNMVNYINANKKILNTDYIISVFLLVVLIISILDMFLNKRDNLLYQLYDVPIITSYIFYIFACVLVFPGYTQRLWINIYFSKLILNEKNTYSYERSERGEYNDAEFDNTKIKDVTFSINEIAIIYEDESIAIFDQSFINKKFYNLENEQISVGYNGLINVRDDGGMIHAFILNNKLRKLVIYDSRFSNLVIKIKTETQSFKPYKTQKSLNLLLNILSFTSLFLACNWFPIFCYLIVFQYHLLCKIEYLKIWQKIIIKILSIMLNICIFVFSFL